MRVVTAVIRDNGQIFICRRNPNQELAGKWEFPGGKVETGESDQVALAREINEELGIAIVVEDFIIESKIPRGLGSINMFTYYARLDGARPVRSTDHDLIEWVDAQELHLFDWADLDIPVVQSIKYFS